MRAFAIFQLATSVWASDVIVLVIGHPLLYILQIYILYFSFLIFDFCASGSSGFSSADTLQHISLENCFRLLVLSNFFCLSLSFYFILFIYFVVFFFCNGKRNLCWPFLGTKRFELAHLAGGVAWEMRKTLQPEALWSRLIGKQTHETIRNYGQGLEESGNKLLALIVSF